MFKRIAMVLLLIGLGTLASVQLYAWQLKTAGIFENSAISHQENEGSNSPSTQIITLTAAGDCLMHGPQIRSGLQADGSYRFDTFFPKVESLIQEGDYSSTDFEAAMAGSDSGYTGYPTFNSPDAVATTLKNAGFDLVVTANNHCLDRGYQGGIRTLQVLHDAGLDTAGTYRDKADSRTFLIKDIRGVAVGYLAYTYSTNGIPVPVQNPQYVNFLDKEKILADIKALRPQVDVLVLVLHWGIEYQPRPGQDQILMAREFLQAGADVILGSHPHVIQTMEIVNVGGKAKFVIYAMGNFISNQDGLERNAGIVLKMKFKKDFHRGETKLQEVSYTPTYSHHYSSNGKVHYQVVPVEQTIQNIIAGKEPYLNKSDLPILQAVLRSTRSQLGAGYTAPADQ